MLASFAALSLIGGAVVAPIAASAQTAPTAAIAGLVVDQRNALPVSNASVIVTQGGKAITTVSTDNAGRFRITLPPGVYTVLVRASGFSSSETDDLAVASGTTTGLNAALIPASTASSSGLAVIGRTSTTANALAAATTISQSLSPQELTATGQIRIADQLATLPAVNFSSSSSVGDDASIDLRGFGSTETASLLDGHPVGPQGVLGSSFNFALGPAFGLSSVGITYGSGAQGLYGSDTIGGAVNYVTLSPTSRPQYSFQQQVGGFGIRSTGLTATGTLNRLGYAFAAGRLGEYGDIAPSQIAQSARPNNVSGAAVNPNGACLGQTDPVTMNPIPEVGACNLALNTYAVSQNTQQSVLLGKLVYALSPATKITGTAYDAVQWADSTGNGDNDYLPYITRLHQVLKTPPGAANPEGCTTSGGAPGYIVGTDPIAGSTDCYTAAQLTAATSGPDGGGAGRQRSTRMGDYHLSLTSNIGINGITIDAYANNYVYQKDSSRAGGIGANGEYLGAPTYADFYNTKGFLVSDEIVTGANDLTLGYTVWHQLQTGNENDFNGIVNNQPQYFGEYSGFLRDNYQFSNQLSVFLNLWMKHSSVTAKTTFDPRATLQFRPSRNDVVQVTYGRSDGAPSPSLKSVGQAFASDPGSSLTSVNCNGYNDVASGGNPKLQSEAANDFELGYGHRFTGDSNVQVNAYVTHVTNQLFGASQPLLQYGAGNVSFAPGTLATYIARLNTQCGYTLNNATVLNYLSVGTTYNAAAGLARGIELSGRARINRLIYLDYGYDIESTVHAGIIDNILSNNATTINGSQIAGIPLHQANVSLDYAPGPWEFRVDNYYVEFNNGYDRPSYYHSNAFVSHSFNHGRTLLTLGGTNIFNNAVQVYGYLGLGTISPVNPVAQAGGTSPSPSEEFGLAPAQLTLTLQQKF